MTVQTRRQLLRCCAAGTGGMLLSHSTHAQETDVITTETPQEVPAAADATISGETTLSEDVTLTVTLRSDPSVNPGFLLREEVSPTDGTWRAEFDLSLTQPGDEFSLILRDEDDQILLEEDWTVVDPELFFRIDSITLDDAEGSSSLTGTFGDSWSQEIPPLAPDETLSMDVRARDDNEELIVFSQAGSIELETDGGITATADGMSITLTATDPGDATLQITIASDRNPDFQAPPLSLTVTDPEDTSSENTSESDDTADGDDSTADDDDSTADDDDSTADDDTVTATDNTTADADAEPADAATDSVPGFTVSGTLAALAAGGYLIRDRLGR